MSTDLPLPPRTAADISAGERFVRLLGLFALLYVFLVAIDLLGSGLGGLGEDFTEELFQGIANPLVGLFVGILATVLAQSSSVTTATIVGLVGTGVIGLEVAVPVVMGANIGTTITNTLASLGSIRRPEEFRRAFTGATMHDFFNIISVAVLLPLELATGIIHDLAIWLSQPFGNVTTGEFHSPVKAFVGQVSGVVEDLLLAVGRRPAVAATLMIVVGLVLIFLCLYAITKNMRVVIAGPAERSLNAVLARSGTLGIVVGVVLTVSVQSSSIATSLLIPMIAAGVLTVENAYPLTLGANLGTTVTALLASLAVDRIEGLQIALVHLVFNVIGVLLLYPVPALRRLPLRAARWVADRTVERRTLVIGYIVAGFYALPLAVILLFR